MINANEHTHCHPLIIKELEKANNTTKFHNKLGYAVAVILVIISGVASYLTSKELQRQSDEALFRIQELSETTLKSVKENLKTSENTYAKANALQMESINVMRLENIAAGEMIGHSKFKDQNAILLCYAVKMVKTPTLYNTYIEAFGAVLPTIRRFISVNDLSSADHEMIRIYEAILASVEALPDDMRIDDETYKFNNYLAKRSIDYRKSGIKARDASVKDLKTEIWERINVLQQQIELNKNQLGVDSITID